MEPILSRDEADAKLELKASANRVTKSGIEAKITDVTYEVRGTRTRCFITVRNGFEVMGEAACVDPSNFDKEIGERYAYDAAFRKLWPLEGYLLAERLHDQGVL